MGEILSFPHDRQHTKSLTVPEIHQCRDPLEVIALASALRDDDQSCAHLPLQSHSGGSSQPGGTSSHGGNGGTGGTNNAATPGGGGGRAQPGARGEVRVTVLA